MTNTTTTSTTTTDVELSQRFNDPVYRATRTARPRWTKIVTPPRGVPCDECAARRHETRGQTGQSQPRKRRAFPGGGPDLKLCSVHAQAWKLRDLEDMR